MTGGPEMGESYIVRSSTHNLCSQLEEDFLQINHAATFHTLEKFYSLVEVGRKNNTSQYLQVGIVQELKTGFSLDSPQITVGIDDAVSCSV